MHIQKYLSIMEWSYSKDRMVSSMERLLEPPRKKNGTSILCVSVENIHNKIEKIYIQLSKYNYNG